MLKIAVKDVTNCRAGLALRLALACSLFGCSSNALDADGGAGGGGGATGGGGQGGAAVPEHRAAAVACPVTTLGISPGPDGGAASCNSDSDCRQPDASIGPDSYCRQHVCIIDQCLTDGDCATSEVCGCANQFGGTIVHMNRCIPSSCQVDADCGAGGLCAPAHNARCGGVTGYHCRSTADTCRVDSDCPMHAGGATSLPDTCTYEPTIGHWKCEPLMVCNG